MPNKGGVGGSLVLGAVSGVSGNRAVKNFDKKYVDKTGNWWNFALGCVEGAVSFVTWFKAVTRGRSRA